MTKITLLTASILAATLSLSACGGDDNETVSQPDSPGMVDQQPLLKGTITDASGTPLADATVIVGSQILTTDQSGAYSIDLTDLSDSEAKVVILIKKPGYLTRARELIVLPDQSYNLDISLTPDQVTTAFDSRSGLSALPISGAKVTIPAGSVVNLDGSDFIGTVQVAANYYNPDSIEGMEAFAQPFAGQDADGSDQTDLVTVGVIDVKLTDPATGLKLDLKDGTKASLSFPAASTDQDLATIPLWYYDEEKLIWVKDGVATRQADGSYQGQVTHFTLWNLDIPVSEHPATIEGCVIDAATKQPFTDNFYAYVQGRGYINSGTADNEGKFDIQVPFNTPLVFYPEQFSVKFDSVEIPALAKDATYQLNGGQCIEVTAANPSDEFLDFNQALNDTLGTLPPAPVDVTPTTPVPEPVPKPMDPIKPPTQENTVGLIGYNFDFDSEYQSGSDVEQLDNVGLLTTRAKANSIEISYQSLYEYDEYPDNFADRFETIYNLTPQGISESAKYSLTPSNVGNNSIWQFEQLNSRFNNNGWEQSLSNGFSTSVTLRDSALTGQKIGDVLAREEDEDLTAAAIDRLNNLPNGLGVFNSGASCKLMVSGTVNMDAIETDGPVSPFDFATAIQYLQTPTRGTWAGVPWAAETEFDEDGEAAAYINYNNRVYSANYRMADAQVITDAEKNECIFFNPTAKEQIIEALTAAYPTL